MYGPEALRGAREKTRTQDPQSQCGSIVGSALPSPGLNFPVCKLGPCGGGLNEIWG